MTPLVSTDPQRTLDGAAQVAVIGLTQVTEAVQAVHEAGWVVMGPGSWFSSVIPHLLVPELRAALSPDNLVDDLLACLNAAELSKRAFRDIARIAGLVFPGYPGAHKSARQVQASSGLVFDVLTRYDADNLLLGQARREVLERELEFNRVHGALVRIAQQSLCIAQPPRLTPLGFPLWVERVASQVTNESWRDRVERMTVQLEKAADRGSVRR